MDTQDKIKIRNECIREKLWVAPIVEKMIDYRLRWFGHMRRPLEVPVWKVDHVEVVEKLKVGGDR